MTADNVTVPVAWRYRRRSGSGGWAVSLEDVSDWPNLICEPLYAAPSVPSPVDQGSFAGAHTQPGAAEGVVSDLLEALKDCVAVLTDPVVGTIYGDDPDWYGRLNDAVDKAVAAIAKATALPPAEVKAETGR